MSSYPAFNMVEGETLDLHICSTIDAKDAVALLYYCGGDEKACVVQPCSLALSQYQLHIGPLGREECVQLPYISIATWGIARASASVAKAFAQVQQAEETARSAAAGIGGYPAAAAAGAAALSVPLHDGSASPNAAMSPLLSPPGQQQPQQPPVRPRYADPLPSLYVVTMQTKHVWQHRLIVQSERLLKNLKVHLAMAHCLARVTDLPAFSYGEERRRRLSGGNSGGGGGGCGSGSSNSANGHAVTSHTNSGSTNSTMWNVEFGWNVYSPHREFTRQLCLDATRAAPAVATEGDVQEGRIGVQRDLRPWFALVDLRDEERARDTESRSTDFFYTSSPTYPDLFLQPKLVDRELLLKAMNARSRARVPAISYVCLRTGAVLARSSQPLMRSPQLGADSDVCYTLINMGYLPHRTQPRNAAAASSGTVNGTSAAVKSPLSTPAPATAVNGGSNTQTSATAVSPTAAAAVNLRPVRPPSLFDDDDSERGGGGGGSAPVARLPSANCTVAATAAAATTSTTVVGTAAAAAAGASQHVSPPGHMHASSSPSRATLPDGAAAATMATTTAPADGPRSPLPPPSHTPASEAAKVLFVADCRPQITAAGNAQLGGGYESGNFYTFCNISFFEIDNIFSVVKAFEKMRGIVSRYQGNTAEKTFLRRLYDADWLAIIQRVLVCAVAAAQSLQSGVSCLVHCTDGWDRTSQCTSLAMLMLDPYYRTVVGFCTLVEKEFCSFGHKFAERSGHQLPGRTSFFTHSGVSSSDTELQQQQQYSSSGGVPRLDTSPIFLQFLDAVFQIHRQYPTCFEFTTELLAYLSEVVYGCLYGTFLCNGEQERRLEGVRLRTASVWTDVLRQVQREKRGEVPLHFVNVWYDAATAWKFITQRRRSASGGKAQAAGPSVSGTSSTATSTAASAPRPTAAAPLADFVLLPNCSSKRLVFWESLYMREDADRYLSYNPHVHTPQRQLKVSWGADFDAFLDAEVAAACAERAAELTALTALENFMKKEATNSAVASLAASGARSAWCVYDAVNCFNCYRAFSIWSTKTQCSACKQYFCTDCQVHDCLLQQY